MFRRFRLLLLATLLISIIPISRSRVPSSVSLAYGAPDSTSLDFRLSRIDVADSSRAQSLLFYHLTGDIEAGRLAISTPEEAERVTRLMVEALGGDVVGTVRSRAAEFLTTYPHPAATEALLLAAGEPGERYSSARSNAREALVALRERRVLPLLLADLEPGRPERIRAVELLGEFGDPTALKGLDLVLADPHLTEREREVTTKAVRRIRQSGHSNIVNNFELSDEAWRVLCDRDFVVDLAAPQNDMYELYGPEYPFVTTDVVLHTFMILMREALNETETLVLKPRLQAFCAAFSEVCLKQARGRRDPALRDLGFRNAAFFAVPSAILSGDSAMTGLPAPLAEKVAAEVAAIRAHEGTAPSQLFEITEDFTKYRARGRHSRKPELTAYFQAMMYLGRMTFRADSAPETRQALLLLEVLENHPGLRKEWAAIDGVVTTFFGENDDLTFAEYERVLRTAAANSWNASRVTRDEGRFTTFRDRLRSLPTPRINTTVLTAGDSSWRETRRGLRIFGQKYNRPAHLFQIRADAGATPSGLIVAAELLGSARAAELFAPGHPPNSALDAPRPAADPLADLSEGFIHSLRPIFAADERRPAFMKSPAWEDKQINAALGGFSELRSVTLLYARDANLYSCLSPVTDRFHGYVGPIPEFYARLDSLLGRCLASLDEAGLFQFLENRQPEAKRVRQSLMEEEMRDRYPNTAVRVARADFEEFGTVLRRLEAIADRELSGEPQTVSDGSFLKSLHRVFQRLALNRSNANVAWQSMATVADVATDYWSRTCLEMGVGRPVPIYVAVPDGDRKFVCKGAVYTYYEFWQPIEQRLDNENWKGQTKSPTTGSHLPWMRSADFVVPAVQGSRN